MTPRSTERQAAIARQGVQSGSRLASRALASLLVSRRLLLPSLLLPGLLLPACSGTQTGSGAASPEQQSSAEYDLAREAFQGGRLRDALEHVQKSISLNEENGDAAYLGAMILLAFCAADERSSDCRFDDAETFARKAIDADEGRTGTRDAKNTLGVILVHKGQYDEAIEVLKPLANDILYASPEKAWGNLGWAYLMRGNADEAIDALRRAIAAQPLFCVGQYWLGLAYEKKDELELAREAFTKAVDTQRPECNKLQDAYDARARVAEKQGHRSEARADLEKCRDISATTRVGKRCAAQLRTLQ
jgi:type IV pilus assembly protein PilF